LVISARDTVKTYSPVWSS